MSALIEVQDLTKVYPDGTRAVDDVSFEVQQGETFGFLGPNGAGKTTTIRILVTLLPKTGGAATVGGFDVERQPERVRSMIGYAGQFIGIDVDLTGRENLVLQGVLVIVVALAMGASIKTGIVGALVMLFVAACFGIVWAALSNVVALRCFNSFASRGFPDDQLLRQPQIESGRGPCFRGRIRGDAQSPTVECRPEFPVREDHANTSIGSSSCSGFTHNRLAPVSAS